MFLSRCMKCDGFLSLANALACNLAVVRVNLEPDEVPASLDARHAGCAGTGEQIHYQIAGARGMFNEPYHEV